MLNQKNIRKIAGQYAEMDAFFAGFSPRGKSRQSLCIAEPQTDLSQDSLEKITGEIETCRLCELGALRKNPVPGQGNPNAQIVFVGEAPGADEDEQGLAFVGRAGKLLTDIINAMGLKRENVFICNIIKCRPPDNRDPRPAEIIACTPYLHRQLALIKPDVIIALGAHPARTLLKTEQAIGKLRGIMQDYYIDDNSAPIKLMPTYHPAYLLRNYSYENRQRVWQDVQKVLEYLGLPIPKKKIN